ncbi:uncharacterized protein TM35_000181160 [Trypanosoma theileri]|uniref:C3H1-type domain-containing protein n=1 Tax=Trypanosoma theileri TaxID=67003 RepID=A0A1X0NV29_9TRYP|nr:uncharacterized protein TM35_000181160 [Trypanosoma theileri]ORC88059.1 hypothetical protein TM35_000181160 [Trypanosoma theileri]
MPKANKHAEVKPSKFRTALCEFYLRQEECPFGTRCAFAHGEHELQTEERNVELLRATGLQRLDGAPLPSQSLCSATSAESSLLAVLPAITSHPRRRPVIVSLPYWGDSPAVGCEQHEVESNTTFRPSPSVVSRSHAHRGRCCNSFSATCSTEAPLMYRHNPYGLSNQYL